MKTTKDSSKTQTGDVNITGKYAAGRDITVNKNANFKWPIITICALTFITLSWIYNENIKTYWSSLDKFDLNDTKNLKVLLLPFKPVQDHLDVIVDYKYELISSLESRKDKDSLAIKIISIEGIECPKTDKEAELIAREKNADLVIWGSYVESSEGPEKLRLRYNLIKDFQVPYINMRSGNQEGKLNKDISKLSSGYLQTDLFYLLNWIEGITSFNQFDFNNALERFSSIGNDTLLLKQYEFKPLQNLSHIFLSLGRSEFAFPILKILKEKITKNPERFKSYDKAALLSDLAIAHSQKGKIEVSIEHSLEAIKILNGSNEWGKDYEEIKSTIYSNLGMLYNNQLKLVKAEENLLISQKSDSLLITNYELDNKNNRKIIAHKINYAKLKLNAGEFENSLEMLDKIEKESKGQIVSNDIYWSIIYDLKAQCYFQLGQYEKALRTEKKVLSLDLKLYDSFHPELTAVYNNLAVYYEKLDSLNQSINYQKKALDIIENNDKDKKTDNLAAAYANYALNLADISEFKKSIEYTQRSIDIRESTPDSLTSPNLAVSYNNMSYTLRKMKDFEKALEYHKKAVDTSVKLLGENHFYTGIFYHKMAETYAGLEDFSNVLIVLQKAEQIFIKNKLANNHPYLVKLNEQKRKGIEKLNKDSELTVSK